MSTASTLPMLHCVSTHQGKDSPGNDILELSTWLDDVFSGEGPNAGLSTDGHVETSALGMLPNAEPDVMISSTSELPLHPLTTSDGLQTETNEVNKIPPVSPDNDHTTTIVAIDNLTALTTNEVGKRRLHSRNPSLVSDSSDNEDIPSRPTKRSRFSSVQLKADTVFSTSPKDGNPNTAVQSSSSGKVTKKPDVAMKKKIRREKNREHAKKSRSKKRNFNIALEESVMALREENKKLRELVYSHFGEQKTKEMVKERIHTPEDRMIATLKKRSNTVLSNSVVHYLESLRCDVNLHAKR